jgi:hypothetical protein
MNLSRIPRIYFLLALVYLVAFPYHVSLRSANELCRLWQTRALVEYHTLDINQAYRDFGPVRDLSVFDRKIYPSKAPLLSFAAVPIYQVLRWVGGNTLHAVPELPLVFFPRLFLTVLPTLLVLVLIRRFLLTYVSAPVADAVVATYSLGSLAFSYSLLFMSHQTTAVLLFATFYILWRLSRGELAEPYYLLAGFLAASAVAAEYTGALGVLGLVVYVLSVFHVADGTKGQRLVRMARAAGLTALGGAPMVAALLAYHWACFGGPFETGYKHLADAGYQPWHLGGFLGIRTPSPTAFILSFFSPLRGLFTLSPFLLLSFYGMGIQLRQARANRKEWPLFVLSLSLWIGYAYFTSSFSYESWGWTTGPRHLTGLVPFLLLPIALCFESWRAQKTPKHQLYTAVGVGLCLASMVVTGALTCVNYVPDSVKSSFWGFALPLLTQGFTPPTALSFLGITTPWAGAVVPLGVLAAAVVVLLTLVQGRFPRALALGTLVGFLVLLALSPSSESDAGNVRALEDGWLAPPGHAVKLWSNTGS